MNRKGSIPEAAKLRSALMMKAWKRYIVLLCGTGVTLFLVANFPDNLLVLILAVSIEIYVIIHFAISVSEHSEFEKGVRFDCPSCGMRNAFIRGIGNMKRISQSCPHCDLNPWKTS